MKEKQGFQEMIAEKYEKGELPVLKRRDTFEFSCVQCGECCRNREDIILNPFDFFRLCKAKEMAPDQFIKKYCVLYNGYYSKLPIIRLDFRPVYDMDGNMIGSRCPFLGKKEDLYFCRVQKDKPFVCFAYPLGRVRAGKNDPEYILQPDTECAGAKKAKAKSITQVVEDWMFGKEKLDIEERFNCIFNEFLTGIAQWINLPKLADCKIADGILYSKWLSMTAELLYANYDFKADEETFLEQLKENLAVIESISKDFVKSFASYVNLKPKIK